MTNSLWGLSRLSKAEEILGVVWEGVVKVVVGGTVVQTLVVMGTLMKGTLAIDPSLVDVVCSMLQRGLEVVVDFKLESVAALVIVFEEVMGVELLVSGVDLSVDEREDFKIAVYVFCESYLCSILYVEMNSTGLFGVIGVKGTVATEIGFGRLSEILVVPR